MHSARFRGKYEYNIDEKGRVNIPSKFRRSISPVAQDKFIITHGTEGCLAVYPADVWGDYESRVIMKMEPTPDNTSFIRCLYDSLSESVLDRQGRISLTVEQINLAGIGKEVLIVGNVDKIEIWNPERYQSQIQQSLESKSYNDLYYEAMKSLRTNTNGEQ